MNVHATVTAIPPAEEPKLQSRSRSNSLLSILSSTCFDQDVFNQTSCQEPRNDPFVMLSHQRASMSPAAISSQHLAAILGQALDLMSDDPTNQEDLDQYAHIVIQFERQ